MELEELADSPHLEDGWYPEQDPDDSSPIWVDAYEL